LGHILSIGKEYKRIGVVDRKNNIYTPQETQVDDLVIKPSTTLSGC
jgi:hypothetical protein